MDRGDGAHGRVGVPLVPHAGQGGEGDATVPPEGAEADLGKKYGIVETKTYLRNEGQKQELSVCGQQETHRLCAICFIRYRAR